MKNRYELTVKEFQSFTKLFDLADESAIEKFIRANSTKQEHLSDEEQINIVLVLDSCSIIVIRLEEFTNLTIRCFNFCLEGTSLIYMPKPQKSEFIHRKLYQLAKEL